LRQGCTNIIDGKVLLAQGDNVIPDTVFSRGRLGPFGYREEELALRILPELMAEDPEASGSIAKAAGSGEVIDEIGSESFVSPVRSVGGLEEEAGKIS
jgi:hypothetical protein